MGHLPFIYFGYCLIEWGFDMSRTNGVVRGIHQLKTEFGNVRVEGRCVAAAPARARKKLTDPGRRKTPSPWTAAAWT